MRLILASASPRRAEILRNAGFAFEIIPADVDESRIANEAPAVYVARLAEEKARKALASLSLPAPPAIVIGADTTVVANGELLGKPRDSEDARRMLHLLSGRTHDVLTGISLISSPGARTASHVETTRVTFAELSDSDIENYVSSREPFDKAGAYGIQGIGGRFVSRIEGCYFNVMGLPLSRLWSMLCSLGWKDFDSREVATQRGSAAKPTRNHW